MVERTEDCEDLCEAAARAERGGRYGGEEAEEAVAVRKGHFWRELVGAAREDDEGAVCGPCARRVLRVREDREKSWAQALSIVYPRERRGGHGHGPVCLEIVRERF
jgi:hypothetical protein